MYQINRTGDKVVKDFQRLCQTGDVAKITPGLYYALTMHGGFIAHYSIEGFRAHFAGRITDLLNGELTPLWDTMRVQYPALQDSVYSDGMTAAEVMRDISRVAQSARSIVAKRETAALRERHLRTAQAIADKYNITITPMEGEHHA